MAARIVFDAETREWFNNHIGTETTVTQCPRCFRFYKPSLGHKCRKKEDKD